MTDSDTTFAVKSVTGGSTVTKPADPTKDSTETTSYSFAGWYTSADGGTTLSDTAFDFNTAITADTVLYAKWTESAITYTYTVRHLFQTTDASGYEQNASYPDETKSGTIGAETQAEAKTVTGFTAQSFAQATIAASGTVVEIKYDRKSYTVTFNANGGNEVTAQTVRYGATATKPADPTKEATATTRYTFAGWYNGDTEFDFATPITDDITLKAKWNETALYTVTLTGGANATISGGNTIQELSDAMETVTFTANDGYYFEDFTDITSNGITATRTSDSVVTVSGTPTGNASITIPDATEQQATTYSITLTFVMEYQEGDTWNDMATKYPDYIKISSNYLEFGRYGLICYKATGQMVSPTDVIDSNKTYEIQ